LTAKAFNLLTAGILGLSASMACASTRALTLAGEAVVPIAARKAALEVTERSANLAVRTSFSAVEAAATQGVVEAAVSSAVRASARVPARIAETCVTIELKAPGMGERALNVFGGRAAELGARNIPASDIPRLVGLAERVPDASARARIIEAYLKAAPLDAARKSWWKEILAVGAGSGMATGFYSGIEKTGQGIGDAARQVSQPSSVAIISGIATAGLLCLFVLHRIIRRQHPNPKKIVNNVANSASDLSQS